MASNQNIKPNRGTRKHYTKAASNASATNSAFKAGSTVGGNRAETKNLQAGKDTSHVRRDEPKLSRRVFP